MPRPLKVLIVEDNPADAELLLRELRRAGFEPDWHQVDTEEGFRAHLNDGLDLVLSDYEMPQFNGLAALKILREGGRQIPFILVSGTIGEDTAVMAMKQGAADYLLKDRLARLGQAVGHALEQTRLQQEHDSAERALRLFRALVDQSNDAVEVIDPVTGQFLDVNEKGHTDLGWSRAEYLTMRVYDIDPTINASSWPQLAERIRTAGSFGSEGIHRRKDGTMFPVEVNARWVRLDRDYIVAVARDITVRKQTEESMRTSEERFRQLLENGSDIITVLDADGLIRYQSPSTLRVLGYRPEDLIGHHLREFIQPEDQVRVGEAMQRALTGLERPTPLEYRVRHRDGTWPILQSLGKSMTGDAGEKLVVVNSRDITSGRQLEEQLRQSQKMEAIGQLSGGVAHDFNNLLTVIKGHIGLMHMKGQVSADIAASLGQIEGAADRASNLTRQLLAFSRQQVMQTTETNLNGLVVNLTKMLRRLLSENIAMEVECAPQPLMIRADAGMVEQVLLNLVVNARDAMPKGGQLWVKTSRVDFSGPAERLPDQARPGAFVCLTVSDSGTGIAPEVLPRIFEPFFTTKEVGKGTGLGLATVYGVMHQHEGWVRVESEVGRGTTFRAYFPCLVSAEAEAETGLARLQARGGHEGILLVEDEWAVREIANAALTGLGYRVFCAPSGVAALQVWQANQHEIELLLTDLIMPEGVNGRELAMRLRGDRPGLPIIYMSGYSSEMAGVGFSLLEGTNYLAKPFELSALARIVRSSLDRGATQPPFNPPRVGA
jgi:two-component system cell cycle sensor histidine kinase/response regulator CckA